MAELPPWLSVTPRDFVLAQQAGAQLGHAIADSTQRAWEARARMQMESEQHQQRAQQQAIENAMNQMAAQRLEQYRRDEVAARSRALDLEQAGLGMRGEGLDIQRERVADMAKFNEEKANAAQRHMDDLQSQRDFMNEMRQREADRRDKEMDRKDKELERARGTRHFFQDKEGKQFYMDPGETTPHEVEYPKKQAATDESSGSLMNMRAALPYAANFLGAASPMGGVLAGLMPLTAPAGTSTNTPPTVYPNPNNVAAPPPAAQPAPTPDPVKSKVDRANDLRKEHPDWTKKQIIDAVNADTQ